jgi:ribosomal protein L30E
MLIEAKNRTRKFVKQAANSRTSSKETIKYVNSLSTVRVNDVQITNFGQKGFWCFPLIESEILKSRSKN